MDSLDLKRYKIFIIFKLKYVSVDKIIDKYDKKY